MINIKTALAELTERYPADLKQYMISNKDRFIYQIETVLSTVNKTNGISLDIGAGFSPCSIVLAQMGWTAMIVDDYRDPGHDEVHQHMISLFDKYSVKVISGNIFDDGMSFGSDEFDCVMTFDSMEHWHQSPKTIFKKLTSQLNEGGIFFIGVPNCVNIRKRLTVPFGKGKWSTMNDWYETPVFRGHVREPDVGDLVYIAKDVGLNDYKVDGRNWIGYRANSTLIRTIIPYTDKLLQLKPSLCSDIYLVAKK